MLLIKCSCGCHSTLHNDFFTKDNAYRCPNCKNRLNVKPWTEISEVNKVSAEDGFQLFSIPDSSTIDFNFNINQ